MSRAAKSEFGRIGVILTSPVTGRIPLPSSPRVTELLKEAAVGSCCKVVAVGPPPLVSRTLAQRKFWPRAGVGIYIRMPPIEPAFSTLTDTSSFPAFSKVSVSGKLSPSFSGCLRLISITWNPPGPSVV